MCANFLTQISMNETIYTTEVSCRVAAAHSNVFYVPSTFPSMQKKNRIWTRTGILNYPQFVPASRNKQYSNISQSNPAIFEY